ncbi:hypothetical protein E4U41_002772 [Claviceps citrina]|nr:hypothetical protein E4U41_002772 [Claviceps citrina]
MGLSTGHPFDRLTRGGEPGIFRASHVEVKLATHAIYTLLSMFRIRIRIPRGGDGDGDGDGDGEPTITTQTLETLRRTIHGQAGHAAAPPPPEFEIYFSKKNCHACAQYISRLSQLTGVPMTLCWKDRLVRIEYEVTRMGEPALSLDEVITVDDDDDDDDDDSEDMRVVDMVDLTEDAEQPQPQPQPQPLSTVLDGLAYCIGQGTRDSVVRAVLDLARIWRRQQQQQQQRQQRQRCRTAASRRGGRPGRTIPAAGLAHQP